jgi:hypothetical protein
MQTDSVDAPITVQNSNVGLGDLLPVHARASILKVAGKFFGQLNTAAVHFSRRASRIAARSICR